MRTVTDSLTGRAMMLCVFACACVMSHYAAYVAAARLPNAGAILLNSEDEILKVTDGDNLDGYTDAAKDDVIHHLPGLHHQPNFRQFSGYLEVDAEKGRNIFYWFTESEKDPANAPVLFWTNGGPGCSGLLGFLTEQGAFRVTRDGQRLEENPYAWNKEVNIFFVEQPAGVGFSYSEDASFYDGVGDTQAAEDNYRIILKFFEKFPQYQKNDFFISSESYGGHYIPMMAKEILDQQATVPSQDQFNFRGLLVGNPYNNPDENAIGMIASFWGRQLVPKPLVDEWYTKCMVQTHVCPMWSEKCKSEDRHIHNSTELRECEDLESEMKESVGKLNPYGLDWPVCNDHPTSLTDHTQRNGRAQRYALLSRIGKARGHKHNKEENFVPCEEEYSMVYLNRKDVQEAIHARIEPSAKSWAECANHHRFQYNETDLSVDMSAYWRYLLDGGYNLKLMIYSGDADSVCATSGTQTWAYDLGYPVTDKWTTWEVDDQVAGYVTKFDGYSLVTVHNAGHEVPSFQPKIALSMLRRFLNNTFF